MYVSQNNFESFNKNENTSSYSLAKRKIIWSDTRLRLSGQLPPLSTTDPYNLKTIATTGYLIPPSKILSLWLNSYDDNFSGFVKWSQSEIPFSS